MLMPIIKNDFFENFGNFFDNDVRFPYCIPTRGEHGLMKTDIKEMDDHFEITMDLPGYAKEDIKAELKDEMLIITAERTQNKDEKDANGHFVRQERFYGSCQRRFHVGEGVSEEDIKAGFDNGVLHISVSKKEEKPEIEEKKLIAIE